MTTIHKHQERHEPSSAAAGEGWVRAARRALAAAAFGLLLTACGSTAPVTSSPPAKPAVSVASTAALVPVKVGFTKTSAEAPLILALDRGYFKQAGLDVQFEDFDSSTKMIAPLGAGQIDAGAGGIAAGLFNAIARDIPLKIVAAQASTPPGHSSLAFLVSKDLMDRGQIKDFKDLRGRKVGQTGLDGMSGFVLDNALRKGGLTLKDVDATTLGFGDQLPALANHALDAALGNEPFVTRSVQEGIAVRWKGVDEVLPNQQTSVLMFAPQFATQRGDAARRFMVAYVQAIREYTDALINQTLPASTRGEILDVLSKRTGVSTTVLGSIVLSGADPNGRVDEPSTTAAYKWFREQNYVTSDVDLGKVIDYQFVDYADQTLGRR